MMGKLKKLTGYRPSLPLSYFIIVLLIDLITTPTFFRITTNSGVLYEYTIDVTNRTGELVVLTVGMTLVVSTPVGADIFMGAVMAVVVAVCTRVPAGSEVSVNEYANPCVLATLAALIAAAVCGSSNGLPAAKLKIQPMVVTLILFTADRGTSQLVTSGQVTYIRVDGHKLLGSNMPGVPIPTPIFVAVIVVVLTYIPLKEIAAGMYIQPVDINERVSRLVGLKSMKAIWMAYAFCGPRAGIVGLVVSPRIYSADTNNTGLSMELDVIAAVTLDGSSLGGGRFSLLGSVTDAYTIQALATTLYTMSVFADQISVYRITAVVLIVAVQSEELKKLRKRLASRHLSENVEGEVA